MTAKFNKTILTLAIVAIASTGFSAKADTFDSGNFDFSFSNSSGTETVAGEISGLVDGMTGRASEILITSDPLGTAPINVTNWEVIWNSFTVNQQGSDITSLNFLATDGNDTFLMNGDNAYLLLGDGYIASGNLDPRPTPEPAYLVLTGLGLGGLVFLKLRRNAVRS